MVSVALPLGQARLALFLALLTSVRASPVAAQASAYVPLDDAAYVYVDALLARGALPSLPALEKPYTAAAIRLALDSALARDDLRAPRRWYDAARQAIAKYDEGDSADAARLGRSTFRAQASVGAYLVAQSSGLRELMLADDSSGTLPGINGRGLMVAGRVVAAARAIGDRRLRQDPEFDGKKDRALAGRLEDAYVDAQSKFGELFLGRLARNWGPPMLDGLQLGHYAYTYDYALARLGTDRLHLSAAVTRLDDQQLSADSVAQRYFTIHRLAGRTRRFELAVSEAIVYGGVNRGVEPALVNPLNLYSLSQYAERQEVNASWSLESAWRSDRLGAWSAQLLIDDLQIDRCKPACEEPASYGLTLAADGLPMVGQQRLQLSYTRVSNLTYRTGHLYERYDVNGVGIGRGFSDYDEARVGAQLGMVPHAVLTPYVAYRRQGEGDYRQPFPVIAGGVIPPGFLSGTVTRVARLAVAGAASAGAHLEATGDVGVNRVTNYRHVAGRTRTTLEGRVRVDIELPKRWRWRDTSPP